MRFHEKYEKVRAQNALQSKHIHSTNALYWNFRNITILTNVKLVKSNSNLFKMAFEMPWWRAHQVFESCCINTCTDDTCASYSWVSVVVHIRSAKNKNLHSLNCGMSPQKSGNTFSTFWSLMIHSCWFLAWCFFCCFILNIKLAF